MTQRTYFLWTLTLPIIVGLLGFVLPSIEGVTFLMAFAAVPYAVCAVLLAALIWHSRTHKQLILLSMSAPLFMGVCMYVFFVAIDPPELRDASRLVQLMSIIPLSAVVAYCYIAFAWLGFLAFKKLGLVDRVTQPNKTPTSGVPDP